MPTGAPVVLTYRLTQAGTSVPFTDVSVDPERPMHLFAVRRDLGVLLYLHPRPTGVAGQYAVAAAISEAGSYRLFLELARGDGRRLLARHDLDVGDGGSGAADLAEDWRPRERGPLRVRLQGTVGLLAGEDATLLFRLDDPRTGEGVRDLQPTLGAPAQVVIVDESAAELTHVQGERVGTVAGGILRGTAPQEIGPEVAFRHAFRRPGLYKVWGLFTTRLGEAISADFVVRAR
jgi:hypothetical protein